MFFILMYTLTVKKNLLAEASNNAVTKPTVNTKDPTDAGLAIYHPLSFSCEHCISPHREYDWIPEDKRYYNKVLDNIEKLITDKSP